MPTPHNVTPQPRFLLRGGVALPAGRVAGGLFVQQVSKATKGGGVGGFHAANVLFFASAQNPNHP